MRMHTPVKQSPGSCNHRQGSVIKTTQDNNHQSRSWHPQLRRDAVSQQSQNLSLRKTNLNSMTKNPSWNLSLEVTQPFDAKLLSCSLDVREPCALAWLWHIRSASSLEEPAWDNQWIMPTNVSDCLMILSPFETACKSNVRASARKLQFRRSRPKTQQNNNSSISVMRKSITYAQIH
jgi:hypothetical protein